MKEEYLKLKQEIRKKLYEYVQLNDFAKAEMLYYDVAKISDEDSLEIAFDIIYKESEENAIYIEETFVENVEERFYKESSYANISSLKERIERNKEKPSVNRFYRQLLEMLNQ